MLQRIQLTYGYACWVVLGARPLLGTSMSHFELCLAHATRRTHEEPSNKPTKTIRTLEGHTEQLDGRRQGGVSFLRMVLVSSEQDVRETHGKCWHKYTKAQPLLLCQVYV